MNRSHQDLDALVERTRGPQVGRRLFHAACGIGYAWLIARAGLQRSTLLLLFGGAAGAALAADVARLAVPTLNRLFFRAFRLFASPREKESVASSTWYAVGALTAFALFPPAHAVCGILVLALADPTASYLGRRWGRRRLLAGSVLGSASFMVVAYLVAVPVAGPWRALPVAALVAAVEATPWDLDDNLTVPLATGLALWMVALVP